MASGGGGTTAADTDIGTAVDDPSAQKSLTSALVDNAVSALSDGGVGSLSSGGSSLVDEYDLADFAETRNCASWKTTAPAAMTTPNGSISWSVPTGTAAVTVTRTFAGTSGENTYNSNADGSPSGITEVWYPGPYFGQMEITAVSDGQP